VLSAVDKLNGFFIKMSYFNNFFSGFHCGLLWTVRALTLELTVEDFTVARAALNADPDKNRNESQLLDLAQVNYDSWLKRLSRFSSFYQDFDGAARCFELWDAADIDVWDDRIPFNFLYIFITPVHAAAALRKYPHDLAPLPTQALDNVLSAVTGEASHQQAAQVLSLLM
jgi:hypothetical protein